MSRAKYNEKHHHEPKEEAFECGNCGRTVIPTDHGTLHRCERCTTIRSNRVAPDDNLPVLLALAAGGLAQPPIPPAVS